MPAELPVSLLIERGPVEVSKILGRGRKKGNGFNVKTFAKMNPGDCISEVPKNKMLSMKSSAHKAGIKIKIRKLPIDGEWYAIWKL